MKIGIPKGMYIYEKPILYETFFKELGCEVIYSKDTDKEIMQNGINLSIDEACLASKIYIGHVNDLVKRSKKEKIDYIFIPRICSFKNKKSICVKFFAIYDICKNIFNANFLTLNIDYNKNKTEFKAFIKLGAKITKNYSKIVNAYIKARNMQRIYDIKKLKEQQNNIKNNYYKTNILVVSHPYIVYDKYLGLPVIKYLKTLNANIIYANVNSNTLDDKKYNTYKKITRSIYWNPSINLINGIYEYKNSIDGIIYLSVFPCGPDSLVNELLIRKIKDIPSINIILDEQEGMSGLYTRLESFYDILEQNNKMVKVSGK